MGNTTGERFARKRTIPSGLAPALLMAGLAFILAAEEVHAQARAPTTRKNAAPAAKPAPDAARVRDWLESLHGNYAIEILPAAVNGLTELCTTSTGPYGTCTNYGVVRTPPTLVPPKYEGTAECQPVGAGPGTQCVFSSNASTAAGMPMVILFGLQTDHPGIRVLSVDVLGRTQGAQASLTRYGIKLDTECGSNNCARMLEFEERKKGILEITFTSGPGPDLIGAPPTNKRIVMQRSASIADAPAAMPSR